MGSTEVWTWALAGGGAFVAVTALVRLMRAHRDRLVAELTAQAREEQERKRLAQVLERRKKRRLGERSVS